jgi:hypothetical protein
MLDDVAKYLPAISIFVLVLGAIFNIGFFYEVGFQFIGVVDINNLVYPFGFIFGVLCKR